MGCTDSRPISSKGSPRKKPNKILIGMDQFQSFRELPAKNDLDAPDSRNSDRHKSTRDNSKFLNENSDSSAKYQVKSKILPDQDLQLSARINSIFRESSYGPKDREDSPQPQKNEELVQKVVEENCQENHYEGNIMNSEGQELKLQNRRPPPLESIQKKYKTSMTENDEIWNESGDDYGQESVNEWQSMKIIIQL